MVIDTVFFLLLPHSSDCSSKPLIQYLSPDLKHLLSQKNPHRLSQSSITHRQIFLAARADRSLSSGYRKKIHGGS